MDIDNIYIIIKKDDQKLKLIEPETSELKHCQLDPRYSKLGYRTIFSNKDINFADYFNNDITRNSDLSVYKQHLYKHGIAENDDDIHYSSAIPLEYNIVLLNGVSFSKGCYLGQELIAKTHHTGVIRKRIVPIVLKDECSTIEKENSIINMRTGKSAGKIKNISGRYGIAMMRLNELEVNTMAVVDTNNLEHKIDFNIPEYWSLDEKLIQSLMKKQIV